jgi:hypothetical protein
LLTTLHLRVLAIVASVAAALSLTAGEVGSRMSSLHAAVDLTQPYFSAVDVFLLYFWMPATVVATFVLVLLPGVLLALALDRGRDLNTLLLSGFALSLIQVSAAVALVQATAGRPILGLAFVLTILACILLSGGFLLLRKTRRELHWPQRQPGLAIGIVLAPLLFLIACTPKLFWESFNGDGAHAHEAVRLLLHKALPFFSPDAGVIAAFPGLNSALFTAPASWLMRLFGEYEAATRLSFVLYLSLLYAAVVLVARHGAKRALGASAHGLIAASLLAFALVMSYSATYDPYCADIALPATQDTLFMVCFLGVVASHLRREAGWMAMFAAMTLLTSPGAPTLLAAYVAAAAIVLEREYRRTTAILFASIAVTLICLQALPALLDWRTEHAAGSLFKKLRYLTFTDVRRVAFILVPCGIYPALMIFRRRFDRPAVALLLTCAAVFAMFYTIAFVSLHYFVPAMILPIVVFWRHPDPFGERFPRLTAAACAAAAIAAVVLSLPTTTSIYSATRQIGETIDASHLTGYHDMQPVALRAADALPKVLPTGYLPEVPELLYGGSPMAWMYYAQHAPEAAKNYVILQESTEPAPSLSCITCSGPTRIYVRDKEIWREHRELQPRGSRGPRHLAISRDILFRREDAWKQLRIVDVTRILRPQRTP